MGLLDLRLWGCLQLQLDLPLQSREGDPQHLTQVLIILPALVLIGQGVVSLLRFQHAPEDVDLLALIVGIGLFQHRVEY